MPVKTGATPERLALAEKARLMRVAGALEREIADALGVSRSYAHELLSDPDGAKARARKDNCSGPCIDCGAPVSGSDGWARRPKRCQPCATVFDKSNRYWTREKIIEVLQDFEARFGRPLTTTDVMGRHPSIGKKLSRARLIEINRIQHDFPHLPHPWTMKREFGSWEAGIAAAGQIHRGTGEPTHREPRRENSMARNFIVLQQRNPQTWYEIDRVEAITADHAIEMAAKDRGAYVAIEERYWVPLPVDHRMVLAIVRDVASEDAV